MDKMTIKTDKELEIMLIGGKKLGKIKKILAKDIVAGVSAKDIDDKAKKLMEEEGGSPSFLKVSGYSWSTCININDGVVHGIPKKELIFKDGDVVKLDLGLYYEGFHTDTALTVVVGKSTEYDKFLEAGRKALKNAIKKAKDGNFIGDITIELEDTIKSYGYTPLSSLTGHGVGKKLHEDPRIPCVRLNTRDERVKIRPGMALAIEIMYTQGKDGIIVDKDGWTIKTKDAKISALFEETVSITSRGSFVLTN